MYNQNTELTSIKYQTIDTNSHASEGGLARISNNKIIVVYRKDPSFAHVSNNSEIVAKISNDNGKHWGEEKKVYNSAYDDRNLIVGNLPNGNIIIVFRRYNAETNLAVDSGYIISSDGGITWNNYTKIHGTENNKNQPFGAIVNTKKESSFLICFKKGIVKKYTSIDNFKSLPIEATIINDSTKIIQEPFLVEIAKGKQIILCRNGYGKLGQSSFYQYNSDGQNYYYKGETNIFDDEKTSVRSPVSMRYDKKSNMLEVCSTSRIFSHTTKNINNELRFYYQNADSVFNNPKAYQLKIRAERPLPNKHWFYGYPKFLNISEKEVLYIVTDSRLNQKEIKPLTHMNNEQANLYFFNNKKYE